VKRLLLLLAAIAAPALAGERYLGSIVSTAGADTTNATTAAPFFVPTNAQLTLWCNATAYVITDTATGISTGADGGMPGLPLTASEKFPTSSGSQVRFISTLLSDGGVSPANGGAIVRIFGSSAVTCHVYTRTGTE
jgi:hypothetical protein